MAADQRSARFSAASRPVSAAVRASSGRPAQRPAATDAVAATIGLGSPAMAAVSAGMLRVFSSGNQASRWAA
nr:hypothetical protein GCM10020092_030410 [Actinoplanes digitatis]